MRVISVCLVLVLLSIFDVTAESALNKEAGIELPFYSEPTLTPQWPDEKGGSARSHRVGSFALTNQEGRPVSEKDFEGKIRIVSFFFTSCPGICSTMTANMVKVQEALLEESSVRLVSFSVMPEVDTVSVLQDYADTYAVRSSKWDLLTGDRRMIYELAQQSYFAQAEGAGDSGGIIHSEKLLLVDPKGRIRGVYNGTLAFDMRRLVEDVRVLAETSS